ncbi:hypothetical protein MPER_01335 [Moniliophthora perniciosa FA553]|nr:hypothetical protein MPER_01335 [Moniliophthora perniciosa FA553]
MFTHKEVLRKTFGDLDLDKHPAFMALKSTHNVIIEVCWKWFRKHAGLEVQEIIEQERTNGLFNPSSPLHCDLFQWLWPKLVQYLLDSYTKYWNGHRIRHQEKSPMPSGVTPNQVMMCPEDYALKDVGIHVTPEAIQELRQRLPDQEKVFCWVSDECECLAQAA